jgi:hypothetical protein
MSTLVPAMSNDEQRSRQIPSHPRVALVRDILVIALVILVAWKLLNANLILNLSGFSFNDLLALLLALFSVWLSVAFYLKASETSNEFYNNTYKFTKDISELLGRIEEGFGERLRHLDEGYEGIRDRVERWQDYVSSPTSSDIQHEKDEIRQIEQKQQDIIDQLAARAQIAESERERIKHELNTANQDLAKARMAFAELSSSENRQTEAYSRARSANAGFRALKYIAHKISESDPIVGVQEVSLEEVARRFNSAKPAIAERALEDLRQIGWMDEDGTLGAKALVSLRGYLTSL